MTKSIQTTLTFILEKDPDSGWFSSQIKEFPQAISQGKTKREAINNAINALKLLQTDVIKLVQEAEQGSFKAIGTFEEFKKDVLKSLKKKDIRQS